MDNPQISLFEFHDLALRLFQDPDDVAFGSGGEPCHDNESTLVDKVARKCKPTSPVYSGGWPGGTH